MLAPFAIVPILAASPLFGAGTFAEFLTSYEAAAPSSRMVLLDSFVEMQKERGGFPIIESDGSVVFFYRARSDENEVSVVGDFTPISHFNAYWNTSGRPMTKVGRLFYLRQKFERDARLDYSFLIDGTKELDPLNPDTLLSGTAGGLASEFSMPDHCVPPETLPRSSIGKGSVTQVEEPWANPAIRIYLPHGYSHSKRYPVVYTADGLAWIEQMKLPIVLDNLIADRSIEPVIAVMIDADKDRRAWHYFNDEYLRYLAQVIDYVDRTYATSARRENRLHVGSSSGGRAALFASLERPAWFGNLAMFSAALDGPISCFEPLLSGKRTPQPPLRVWISAGTYEGVILDEAETAARFFRNLNMQVREVYVHQGHSFGAWRELSVDMLRFFFSMDYAALDERGATCSTDN